MSHAYLIGGHGDDSGGSFTVPQGCFVIAVSQAGKNISALEFLEMKLRTVPLEMIQHPYAHIDELQEAIGSCYVYGPKDFCPNFTYGMPGVIPYRAPRFCIDSGIIDLATRYQSRRRPFSILYDRNAVQFINDLYKDSIYPLPSDVTNLLTLYLDCDYYTYRSAELERSLDAREPGYDFMKEIHNLYNSIIDNMNLLIRLGTELPRLRMYQTIMDIHGPEKYKQKYDELHESIMNMRSELQANHTEIHKLRSEFYEIIRTMDKVPAIVEDIIYVPYTDPPLDTIPDTLPTFQPISKKYHHDLTSLSDFLVDVSFTCTQEDLCYLSKGAYYNFTCRIRHDVSSHYYDESKQVAITSLPLQKPSVTPSVTPSHSVQELYQLLSPTLSPTKKEIRSLFSNLLSNTLRQKHITANRNYNNVSATRNAKRLQRVRRLYRTDHVRDILPDVRRSLQPFIRKVETLSDLIHNLLRVIVVEIRTKPHKKLHLGERIYMYLEKELNVLKPGLSVSNDTKHIIRDILTEVAAIKIDIYRVAAREYLIQSISEGLCVLMQTHLIDLDTVIIMINDITENGTLVETERNNIFMYIEDHWTM